MASPVDLPRRLVASIGNSIDAASELPTFQRQLLGHLQSMDEGIHTLVAEMSLIRADISELGARATHIEQTTDSMRTSIEALERSISSDASERIGQISAGMARIETHVANIDEMIPDPDAPGTLAKARDALTGNDSTP